TIDRVVRERRRVIGNLALFAVAGRQAFAIRVPVIRQGKVEYVLSATVDPNAMQEVIERQKVPPDGVVSILDANGRHVARSRRHEAYLGHQGAPRLRELMAGKSEGWGP